MTIHIIPEEEKEGGMGGGYIALISIASLLACCAAGVAIARKRGRNERGAHATHPRRGQVMPMVNLNPVMGQPIEGGGGNGNADILPPIAEDDIDEVRVNARGDYLDAHPFAHRAEYLNTLPPAQRARYLNTALPEERNDYLRVLPPEGLQDLYREVTGFIADQDNAAEDNFGGTSGYIQVSGVGQGEYNAIISAITDIAQERDIELSDAPIQGRVNVVHPFRDADTHNEVQGSDSGEELEFFQEVGALPPLVTETNVDQAMTGNGGQASSGSLDAPPAYTPRADHDGSLNDKDKSPGAFSVPIVRGFAIDVPDKGEVSLPGTPIPHNPAGLPSLSLTRRTVVDGRRLPAAPGLGLIDDEERSTLKQDILEEDPASALLDVVGNWEMDSADSNNFEIDVDEVHKATISSQKPTLRESGSSHASSSAGDSPDSASRAPGPQYTSLMNQLKRQVKGIPMLNNDTQSPILASQARRNSAVGQGAAPPTPQTKLPAPKLQRVRDGGLAASSFNMVGNKSSSLRGTPITRISVAPADGDSDVASDGNRDRVVVEPAPVMPRRRPTQEALDKINKRFSQVKNSRSSAEFNQGLQLRRDHQYSGLRRPSSSNSNIDLRGDAEMTNMSAENSAARRGRSSVSPVSGSSQPLAPTASAWGLNNPRQNNVQKSYFPGLQPVPVASRGQARSSGGTSVKPMQGAAANPNASISSQQAAKYSRSDIRTETPLNSRIAFSSSRNQDSRQTGQNPQTDNIQLPGAVRSDTPPAVTRPNSANSVDSNDSRGRGESRF